jgi:hypothetical protein
MMYYDLCICWNWEYDLDFVALLESACQRRGLSLLQVTPENVDDVQRALDSGELSFGLLLDRASDDDEGFMPVARWCRKSGIGSVNPYEKAQRAWNKAHMHGEFLKAGLQVPRTIILPPYSERPALPFVDVSPLGSPFSIKPGCRGGGLGVVNDASSLEEAMLARQVYPDDPYLLQAHVHAVHHGPRLAWFRVIYCAGQTYPCWWDIATHVYTPLDVVQQPEHAFARLHELVCCIAQVCGLQLFSTEVALTADNRLLAVDYVNDPLDLRLQSRAVDGVPDRIVQDITMRLASLL